MFKTIENASFISKPVDTCWTIQNNTVWSEIFRRFDDGTTRRIIQFKLRRLLYDEIFNLVELPNYRSARILGLCLNVMGLKVGDRKGFAHEEYALRRTALEWTKRNYLRVREEVPDVADACLMGSITFEAEAHRLVKTYAKGLEREPHREYLDLDPPRKTEKAGRLNIS